MVAALKSRWVLAAGIGLVLLVMGAASADALRDPNRGPRDGTWERIQTNRYLIVGVDPSIPPFGRDTPQGPIGLDPAIAREIGRRLGLEVRFILLSFDGLHDALLLGEADMVVAALRPDPMRRDRVRYTPPYFDAGHVLVGDYPSLEALSGKSIAVEFASEGDIAARRVDGLEILRYFTANEAIDAVMTGEADAALVDYVSAALYPTDLALPAPLIPDPYVIALRRHDWRLVQAVENTLAEMQADGTLNQLAKEWIINP